MDLLLSLGVTSGVLAAVLVNIAIWAPRRLWVKLAALATAAALLPVAYLGFAELLGRPKPAELQWSETGHDRATVLAARMREGEAIYLWLGFDDLAEPRSYVLPWDDEAARELHGAQGEAEESGAQLRVRLPLDTAPVENQPLFYAEPQPAPPPKAQQSEDPLWFQRPSVPSEG
jgi:hypothetical protein